MNVIYNKEPSPHFIIDDFLTPRAAREILEECINLEPYYEDATTFRDHADATHPDDCEQCKINAENHRGLTRDNQTLSLDKMYTNQRNRSKTLTYLHDRIQNIDFISLMKQSESIFPILNQINSSETMLSRYGKCDFYGWHTDSIPNYSEKRVITISYYVNKEPLNFNGGGLLLLHEDGKTTTRIEPKHNRAVIFPSHTAVHSVEYVDLSGKEWDEGRFSVQFWTGFNSNFKFR